MALKVSVSGIRGVVGDSIDAESISRWASAFGAWLPPGRVVVARDTRPSGPMISAAVQAALMSTGHDVVDGGMLTTPTTEMLVQESDAVGGVIVTASHNPVEWNALKLLRGDGLFLDASEVDAVIALERAKTREHKVALECGGLSHRDDGDALHLDAICALDLVDVEKIRSAKLKATIDAVEGAGGDIVPTLLDRLGVEHTDLYCECTGIFPRDPEPRPERLGELAEEMKRTGSDVGFAVDPDVDRLALVDKGGIALSEEITLAIASDFVLSKMPGPMVVNLSTTLAIDRVAEMHGVELRRAPVGEANVVAEMLATGAVVGGEGNGGVIFPTLHAGRDAVLGIALVLAAIVEHGSLRACLDRLPTTAMSKDKLDLQPEIDDPAQWRKAALVIGEDGVFDDRDGVRYALGDRWVHLRRSNTEPVLRIIAEGESEEHAQQMILSVRGALGA